MSRILYQNMGFFKHSFDSVIDWHIKHEFYDEVSTKSTVVSSHFFLMWSCAALLWIVKHKHYSTYSIGIFLRL